MTTGDKMRSMGFNVGLHGLLLCCTVAAIESSPHLSPILAPIGVVEVVWNRTSDACNTTCEEPDSMPIAWHNPLTNMTSLISATRCTYATVGPSLDNLIKHDCSYQPFVAANLSTPWSYRNHQWLQSAYVFPNGSGFAWIHNEFHGEQPPHNLSYCSFEKKTSTGQCIEWSTDLAETTNGGNTWTVSAAPVITLPRKYIKDAAIAGYGELGSVLLQDGMYYTHVYRSYKNNTGGGPPNTIGSGTCVFRTPDPRDPTSLRGWNGTDWSTTWVDPYVEPSIPPEDLWRHTCASIDLGDRSDSGHVNPKKFVGPLTNIQGWPTHVMTGLQGEKFTYFYPNNSRDAGDAAVFTAWSPGVTETVDIASWADPCLFGGYKWMYPNLIDHSSPFGLSSDDEDVPAGLSYGLAGNTSLYLYAVLSRKLIVRLPVAFFTPGQAIPKGPFKPPPPPKINHLNCSAYEVSEASISDVNGKYLPLSKPGPNATQKYQLDSDHQLYNFRDVWELGHEGQGGCVYYKASEPSSGIPVDGWAPEGFPVPAGCTGLGNPTVVCIP